MDRSEESHDRLPCPDIPLEQSSHRMRLTHISEDLEEDDFLLIRKGKREI